MTYLINRLMDTGKVNEAEQILLDPRVSITLYPLELWSIYLARQGKVGNYARSLKIIDSLNSLCINDVSSKLYNFIMEKHVQFKHRSQPKVLLEIAEHLI